jgi:membrane associated rhomboid family serine protease
MTLVMLGFLGGVISGIIGARSPDFRLTSTRFQKLLLTLRWTFALAAAEAAWFLLISGGDISVIVFCAVVGAASSLASVLGFDEARRIRTIERLGSAP